MPGDKELKEDKELKDVSRRSFIQRTAMGGAGLLIAKDVLGSGPSSALSSELSASTPEGAKKSANATMIGVPFEARERVRLGIIGVGGRGTNLLDDLLAIDKVEVKATE